MGQSEIKKMNFHSKILEKNMSMSVYLPDDHNKALPVLYFLHGRSGNEDLLLQLNFRDKLDQMIEQKRIKPIIVVCPRLDNSRGLNSSLVTKEIKEVGDSGRIINLGMYEDYFIKEVIPLVDKEFNTIGVKKGRYIGGISAGGYIALHQAFRHMTLFSKVGGHMPALELTLEEDAKAYFEELAVWEEYDPLTIVKNIKVAKDLRVYLDAGDQDEGEFYKGCKILYQALTEQGIMCQNHIYPGHHCGEYIQSNLERYLEFYGN